MSPFIGRTLTPPPPRLSGRYSPRLKSCCNSECSILTVPASCLPCAISCGHRSLPRAQVTIIFLFHFTFGHLTPVIYHCFYNRPFGCTVFSILQCLAIHSMSAAGNNKCDLHTYTDIINAGRSMLILGKGFKNSLYTQKILRGLRPVECFSQQLEPNFHHTLGFCNP